MAAHRFFSAVPIGAAAGECLSGVLSAADEHHARDVLRLEPGEMVELVDPDGGAAWSARVTVSSPHLEIELIEPLPSSSAPRITLVQGVAKGDKMDAIVRQAVEVGAEDIVPVLTSRTIVRLDARKRAEKGERWRRVAKSAAQQAHRDRVPHVYDPRSLGDLLPLLRDYDAVLVLWEDAVGPGLDGGALDGLAGDARVAVVVGPEGGLSAEEVARLEESGARPVTLGPTILRTETAAVVAVALVAFLCGGLGADRDR